MGPASGPRQHGAVAEKGQKELRISGSLGGTGSVSCKPNGLEAVSPGQARRFAERRPGEANQRRILWLLRSGLKDRE